MLDQIPPVVHAPRVRHERSRLREPENESPEVCPLPCARVRGDEAGGVGAGEGGLQAEAGNGADVADGLDGELEEEKKVEDFVGIRSIVLSLLDILSTNSVSFLDTVFTQVFS